MTIELQVWKRLLGLMESYLELDAAARPAWLDSLAETDPESHADLVQLLRQRNMLQKQKNLETQAYAGAPDDDATVTPRRARSLPAAIAAIIPPPSETTQGNDTSPEDPDATRMRDAAGKTLPPVATRSAIEKLGELREGDVLDGRYTLVSELGRGGMSTVYKALDANRTAFQDRQPYIALKLLGKKFRHHPDSRMALQRETVRAQGLSHENIVRVYDFDYNGTFAYMTMELLEGRTLEDWLQDDSSKNAPWERRWEIMCGVGAGLSCAHKNGVVHSDLKPGNVFLCKKGGVKVMDFGISRPLRAVAEEGTDGGTRFDVVARLGALTPAYASLEQLNYEAPDPRDDVYAFGCVVYFLFSGRHPFDRESAQQAMDSRLNLKRIPSLTRLQWETLKRALAFKRSERIGSIDEFLRLFARRTWWRKHRGKLGIATLAVVGTGLFFGTQYYNEYVEDQAFNAQLWPGTEGSPPQLTVEQQRDIDDYLYLAKINLQQAATARSPEELSALLSRGDNNLLDLLKRIRGLQPANPQALRMTESATQLYAAKVRALLAANEPEAAMVLLREAQNFGHTRELFRLRRQICSSSPATCGVQQPVATPTG